MNIPQTIKIGRHIYTVHIVNVDHGTEIERIAAGGSLSRTIYKDNAIELFAGQTHERMVQSLLHEIVRGIIDDIGERYYYEREIRVFAEGLHQLIRDNPGLLDGLANE